MSKRIVESNQKNAEGGGHTHYDQTVEGGIV